MTSERKGPPSPVSLNCQLEEVHMKRKLVKSSNEEEIINAPLSPRVRRRLDSAKENANIFGTGTISQKRKQDYEPIVV
jgi:hypothetical protein